MRIALLAALLIAAPALASGTLRIGLDRGSRCARPHDSGSFAGRIVFAATCDKLIDLDPAGKLVPQLATAWHWSDDGRTLTLNLRDGVKFQDGEPFDAEAARASIEALPHRAAKSAEIGTPAGQQRGGRGSTYAAAAPEPALCAAGGRARRPRRHDDGTAGHGSAGQRQHRQ